MTRAAGVLMMVLYYLVAMLMVSLSSIRTRNVNKVGK